MCAADDAAVVGDATADLAGVLEVVRGVLEGDRAATLAEADHDVGRAALDGLADHRGCAVVLDRQHEAEQLDVVEVRRVHAGDGLGGDVRVRAVGGERLEAGDQHLGAVRIALVGARMRGTTKLDTRGIAGGADLQICDIATLGEQGADGNCDQRAKAGSRLGGEAVVEQLLELGKEVHAAGVEALERAEPGELEGQQLVVGDHAAAGCDDETEVLREHLGVIDLDTRVAPWLEAQPGSGDGIEVDRQIDPARATAQA